MEFIPERKERLKEFQVLNEIIENIVKANLRILAGAGGGCIETLVTEGLGSTCVRTLYLLLDCKFEGKVRNFIFDNIISKYKNLKFIKYFMKQLKKLISELENSGVDPEKVTIFISSFGQLLSRLLRGTVTTEDLVAKDDLKLLFIAASTAESQAWRRVSADSLMGWFSNLSKIFFSSTK